MRLFECSRCHGQSSVEYLVVIAAFTGAFALAGNVDTLNKAIRDYFTDYSYAMAIAQVPDCINTYGESVGPVAGSVTLDKCPNLTNPKWPVSEVSVSWTQ
ncbi:hypothetical protein FNU76_23275 [Chitinimonas arctica]|uniref:Uncharacterized protein n=1 Tax=Chitinimonas arctica TaxID=2594795 RepID=A0A516SLL6_9NEIS|nr:hypothetical protein [Chitinimonas arctica]QDQ29033.1 hypothetical protein FNU76_23275 [Chitinimonas arctica]